MSNKVKDIDIKTHTCYFSSDIIDIKNFDLNNINISKVIKKKHSYLLHWICDDKDSKYLKINTVNLLYLTFNKVNGYFEELEENKYSALVPIYDSKEKIKK